MDVNQLMIPVYINEKIVLDMLAIIEDGFSTVSQVSYSDHKENSNAQKIEAEVSTSASILSKLLKIVICKQCGRPEYWGEMRWLSGKCTCRNCYRANWQDENKALYEWDDLDGPRPTMDEYEKQEKEARE